MSPKPSETDLKRFFTDRKLDLKPPETASFILTFNHKDEPTILSEPISHLHTGVENTLIYHVSKHRLLKQRWSRDMT